MAEYRLCLMPSRDQDGWDAYGTGAAASGPTIGDAVRACVARIKSTRPGQDEE